MNVVRTSPWVSLVTVSVGVVAVLAAGLSAAQQAQSPLLGRWKFNSERSDFSQEPMVIAGDPKEELTLTLFGQSHRFKLDGRDYPGFSGQTSAWKQVGPRRWEVITKLKGEEVYAETMTLSDDEQTLTTVGRGARPRNFEESIISTRVSGSSGLVGTWRAKTIRRDSHAMEFTSNDGRNVTVRWLPWDDTAMLDFEGKEAPVTGPIALPGMTAALTRKSDRVFELVGRQVGNPTVTATLTVSEDGKVLTWDAVTEGAGKAKSVYDRQ